MAYEWENSILPEFPRTEHLPALGDYIPNAHREDLIADPKVAAILNDNPNVVAEEKIDAANSGICHYDGQPIIRNRNHILAKGYGRKRTNAKLQFASIWNWYYEHQNRFEKLNDLLGFNASVYGEWMWFINTIHYDKLPDYFIAYDIYDSDNKFFLNPLNAREALMKCGFSMPALLEVGVKRYDELAMFLNRPSAWAAGPDKQNRPENQMMEGLYFKAFDSQKMTHRFKMVRPSFKPGENFTGQRNWLAK